MRRKILAISVLALVLVAMESMVVARGAKPTMEERDFIRELKAQIKYARGGAKQLAKGAATAVKSAVKDVKSGKTTPAEGAERVIDRVYEYEYDYRDLGRRTQAAIEDERAKATASNGGIVPPWAQRGRGDVYDDLLLGLEDNLDRSRRPLRRSVSQARRYLCEQGAGWNEVEYAYQVEREYIAQFTGLTASSDGEVRAAYEYEPRPRSGAETPGTQVKRINYVVVDPHDSFPLIEKVEIDAVVSEMSRQHVRVADVPSGPAKVSIYLALAGVEPDADTFENGVIPDGFVLLDETRIDVPEKQDDPGGGGGGGNGGPAKTEASCSFPGVGDFTFDMKDVVDIGVNAAGDKLEFMLFSLMNSSNGALIAFSVSIPSGAPLGEKIQIDGSDDSYIQVNFHPPSSSAIFGTPVGMSLTGTVEIFGPVVKGGSVDVVFSVTGSGPFAELTVSQDVVGTHTAEGHFRGKGEVRD